MFHPIANFLCWFNQYGFEHQFTTNHSDLVISCHFTKREEQPILVKTFTVWGKQYTTETTQFLETILIK